MVKKQQYNYIHTVVLHYLNSDVLNKLVYLILKNITMESNPLAIANYFINRANDEGVDLTPMKLVKLVYISHGWYLAMKNESLIDEGVQAWKYGPVVPSVYRSFKEYKDGQVTRPAYIFTDQVQIITPIVLEEDKIEFLNDIWKVYKKYNGLQLSTLTHQKDTPWYEVWHNCNGKNKDSVPIPNQLIKEHYQQKLNNPVEG